MRLRFRKKPVLDRRPPVTERELQIARLIVSGISRQEIASRLGISVSAVSQTNRAIDAKLGLPYRPHGRPTKADRLAYLNALAQAVSQCDMSH